MLYEVTMKIAQQRTSVRKKMRTIVDITRYSTFAILSENDKQERPDSVEISIGFLNMKNEINALCKQKAEAFHRDPHALECSKNVFEEAVKTILNYCFHYCKC